MGVGSRASRGVSGTSRRSSTWSSARSALSEPARGSDFASSGSPLAARDNSPLPVLSVLLLLSSLLLARSGRPSLVAVSPRDLALRFSRKLDGLCDVHGPDVA